mmetsp:Transcript_3728/g.7123  ORF Transcript_3728/g.7123 Transcript_3728/m.7123 type:complete len:91 (+) Transcript_3728:419-691(+)
MHNHQWIKRGPLSELQTRIVLLYKDQISIPKGNAHFETISVSQGWLWRVFQQRLGLESKDRHASLVSIKSLRLYLSFLTKFGLERHNICS